MMKPLHFIFSALMLLSIASLEAQEGCTDLLATNYDPAATIDDGSCAYVYCDVEQGTAGFPADTDCEAVVCSIDPFCCDTEWDIVCAGEAAGNSECSDCLSPIPGCNDPYAVNYDPEATVLDGSCAYNFCNQATGTPGFAADPECETAVCNDDPFCCDNTWDQICALTASTFEECAGCIAPSSLCTDPMASNFNPDALTSDDSDCEYVFCDQPQGSTGFPSDAGCASDVCSVDPYCCETEWDIFCAEFAATLPACSDCLSVNEGCTDPMAINYDPNASVSLYCDQFQGTPGFPASPECEAVVCADDNFCCETSWDNVCASMVVDYPECTECAQTEELCEYTYCDVEQTFAGFPLDAGCETAVCAQDDYCCDTEWDDLCAGLAATLDECSGCITPVPGCTLASADNYNPDATVDDGSCVVSGCTDPLAINYNPAATESADVCDYTYCNDEYPTAGFPSNVNCETAVCADDAFCCEAEWDTFCASVAMQYSECYSCLDCSEMPTDTILEIVQCEPLIINGQTYTQTGVYQQSTLSQTQCDSSIVIEYTRLPSTTVSISQTACDEFNYNDVTYTNSGLYVQSGVNADGCEETTYLNLTINNSNSSLTTVFQCDEYEFNGTVYTESGSYSQVLTNEAGCDSTANLDLTIPAFETSVDLDGNVLTSNDNNAGYQWVDCNDGFAPIDGATEQSFTPDVDGSYAVELTITNPDNPDESCTVMSACFDVIFTGIENHQSDVQVSLFPNPTLGDQVRIEVSGLPASTHQVGVEIYNSHGQRVHSYGFGHQGNTLSRIMRFDDPLAPGMYLVQLKVDGKSFRTERLVVQ